MSLKSDAQRSKRWVEAVVLLVILAVAAFFRFTQLDSVPPGMTHDEAAFGAEAEQILAGARPIYFSLGYGHEPMYAYLVAAAFSLLGHTMTVMRATNALCGVAVVLSTYLVARQMFGTRVAWISAAWMAVAFWPVSLSRQALRCITLPLLWLPVVWWFGHSLGGWDLGTGRGGTDARDPAAPARGRRGVAWWLNWAVAGLLLGGTAYTYMASRLAWVVFPVFIAYLLLFKQTRAALKRLWPGLLATLLIAALVAMPLALYLGAHPDAEKRVGSLMAPFRQALEGHPERLLRHVWNAVRVFSWYGDTFWAYNIPGRPVFDWAGSLLFYGGLLLALWRWRQPRSGFVLIWLAVGMAPALITTNEGIFWRAIVAQPAVYVLVACGMAAAMDVLGRVRLGRWGQVTGYMLAIALVGTEATRGYVTYFVDWPSRPQVRNIYNQNLVATARYLRDSPESGAVGISTLYPLYYHDPWIVRYVAGRGDLQIRWFDGRGCVVYPDAGEARYVFSALTPLDPALQAEFTPQAEWVARVELAPDDQNPYLDVWRWAGAPAWAMRLSELEAGARAWASPEVQFTQPELRQVLQAPVDFGDVMALAGYRVNGQRFKPGNVVELVTYWRALRTVQEQDDWNTFVHLLDGDSRVIGGVDVLHCPPTGWEPGDVAVQVHRFAVAGDAAAGASYLELGVYRRTAGRVSVLVDGEPVGDRVLLVPLQIE